MALPLDEAKFGGHIARMLRLPLASAFSIFCILTAVGALAALSGCEETSRAGSAPTAVTAPADATYTVRGRIADVIGDEVSIQHEEIADFKNRDGETVGMMTMTMAFYRPDSVSMHGLAVGDAVELTFEMRWEGDHRLTIAALSKLPDGTELEL
ncbi:MAG: copper-binding protein [Deltaproteobacteria bacterium]|nr:copper-binding protein [Deltaproteobacteria bacterium]